MEKHGKTSGPDYDNDLDKTFSHDAKEVVPGASGDYDGTYGVGGVGKTQRRLKARHVTFIGIGGGIGTGLFIGTGAALAKAGPAGLLL